MREVTKMFNRKYSPSIKANNQLKDKVVAEINAFVYRLERGRYTSESDQEAILRIIEDLKSDVEILSNTVGTGEENIGALADGILELLKDLKRSSEQDTLHRIQEVADDLDFNINLWKDVLDGSTIMPSEEEVKAAKVSHTRKKLNARLSELSEIKEGFSSNARRIEKEITGYEKDLAELDAAIVREDNERKINELFNKITSLKSKIDSLSARKATYLSCFNQLDIIYVNASEIVEASDYAVSEIGKAKALLNIGRLKKVMSEPEKAFTIIKHMLADIKDVYEKTKAIDAKITDLTTSSTTVSEGALAYKAELMRKQRERDGHAEDIKVTVDMDNNNKATAEEEN